MLRQTCIVFLVGFATVVSSVKTGFPWPTPDWHRFYDKTSTSSSAAAAQNNNMTIASGLTNLNTITGNSNAEVCSTDACNSAAKRFLGAINPNVNPCDDFFEYACGNWITSHTIPDNETEVSQFKDLIEKMKIVVQTMLDTKKNNMFQSEVKVKSIYTQCRNQDEIEQLKSKPILDLLEDEFGGWPLLNPKWKASSFDLFKALSKARIYGDEPFFSVSVDQNVESPTENIIFITEPETFATKDVLLSDAGKLYTDSYTTYMFNVTSLMLRDVADWRNVAAVSGELADIMDLGRYISLSGQSAVEKRDVSDLKNRTALGANQQKTFTRSTLFRRMTNLIQSFFEPVNLADKITPETEIVLRYSPFFDRMDEKLVELEALGDVGRRRLANYIGWRIITGNIQYLSKEYRDAYEEHVQRIQGQKTKKEKTPEERCATDITNAMPLAVGAIYVRDNIPKDMKAKASMMVNDIRLGFSEQLRDATWMDNETMEAAVSKLNAMLSFVAYPDVLSNNISAIDAEYSEMGIGSSYFATLLELTKVKNFKTLRKLVKKNQRDDPIEDAVDITTVNAYNMVFKNFIVVLAAILQTPFYESQNPEYLNYGGIGFVIGHETTHGFDDQGASFDDQGQMRSWWTNSTREAYNSKKQSFVEQYNAYNLTVGNVNGELTLGENIADNGGLKAAYRAYFKYFQKRLPKPEPLLPGMPTTTAEQLFFLAAAQGWCGKKRPETERLSLLTDEHSPYKFRIIGPMSNMPEFAAAFNCPVGTKMNPSTKRTVW